MAQGDPFESHQLMLVLHGGFVELSVIVGELVGKGILRPEQIKKAEIRKID